jgi:hypothetical protein
MSRHLAHYEFDAIALYHKRHTSTEGVGLAIIEG